MSWTLTITAVSLVYADNKASGVKVSYNVTDDTDGSQIMQGSAIGSDRPTIVNQIKGSVQAEKNLRTTLAATLAAFTVGETFPIP